MIDAVAARVFVFIMTVILIWAWLEIYKSDLPPNKLLGLPVKLLLANVVFISYVYAAAGLFGIINS